MAIDIGDGATAYLRREAARWRVRAGETRRLTVGYTGGSDTVPAGIRLVAAPGSDLSVDLTLRLSQVESNAPLPANAFSVRIPPDATPLTLAELRDSGPMGEGRKK